MSSENAPTVHIDLDAACTKCGEKGATPSGLCLKCVTDRVVGGIQTSLEGMAPADSAPSMIARVSALAVKIVFPFIAKDDIRYYLMGANIRPIEGGGVMVLATDGHRYVVVRDSEGYAEKELIVAVLKDGLKHATSKHTFDVMSNGRAMIVDETAQPLFIQPNNSIIDGKFPRIENVASTIGYAQGISGGHPTAHLADALEIGEQFGAIQFYSKKDDDKAPLLFVCHGIGVPSIECFGGIMPMERAVTALPTWFPKRGEPTALDQF